MYGDALTRLIVVIILQDTDTEWLCCLPRTDVNLLVKYTSLIKWQTITENKWLESETEKHTQWQVKA